MLGGVGPFRAADVEGGAARAFCDGGGIGDGRGELFYVGESSGFLATVFDEARVMSLQDAGRDGAFDEVSADNDDRDAALGELGDQGADGVFAGTLAFGDGLVDFVDRLGLREMGEVAGDEDDAATCGHERESGVDEVYLRVEVEVHGVVGGLAFLEASAGVEDEDVEV